MVAPSVNVPAPVLKNTFVPDRTFEIVVLLKQLICGSVPSITILLPRSVVAE